MALTRVINPGASRFIGYLPPHGIFMTHGTQLTLDGDLHTILASGRARYSRKTELSSLDAEILSGAIILSDEDDSSSSV